MTSEEKMTPEEAIAEISFLKVAVNKVMEQALDMAIQALSQEPTDENIHREREQAYMQGYEDASKRFRQEPCTDAVSREAVLAIASLHTLTIDESVKAIKRLPSVNPQPCDDAISRDMALEKMADYVASGYADSAEDFEEYSRIICQLPSVTRKSGKWIVGRYKDTCSHCRCTYPKNIGFKNYCPNCGAKMVESQESEE